MESVLSRPVGSGFFCGSKGSGEIKRGIKGSSSSSRVNFCSFGDGSGRKGRRMVVVRAEGVGINPDIRKSEEKVVDSVVVTELSKPTTAYCRCWRSKTFPLCDGGHVQHNKATGDNVGPLLLKK
ncbi:CDGSH iron-sulfur domain-containing protein NEET [Senna tora]|uniref:CDGSH iron-sulfur domain-containing protein NEET n=1 Tax=Senna tora TaxID=362788 RepID=A0A834T003_9FABA|nr:CDGSH iron-sulfur domain-containing protein NEET [Senna tora]